MKSILTRFKISDHKNFSLKKYDTDDTAGYEKESAEELLADLIKETAKLQTELYAANSKSLLIIFQAMDAAGKDSAIAHTMSGLNPQGCQVYSFKQPTSEDYEHDFLWRHYKALPERGRIGIHNRSHYENVLVTKVHPEFILKENIPGINKVKDIDKKFWEQRYESIRDFEKHQTANGTVIVKFFLHLSKEEQKKRFLKRIADPEKNWKFASGDIKERALWNDYMEAYETAIKETSTADSPWYVVPADKKWFTRIAISTIILQTLKDMKLEYPVLPKEEMEKLTETKRILEKE
ncbi:polyphosphate kinase 2 family protein [Mucilaginibacter phyllosphaerae]|uniref:PPK2 family polyphosphate:nucleotide phosphotransferase n=1 Tax=Mucilaginibacter phyllosphaerae TaxID=1812349 RepID=A0A4Y8A812_9SPHI|nr:polyphosphate kinase 2 family protein [Mucilaginibacter phyllosphaerae]MBB3970526.1 PPK2 family polyphosphate:nucleotide phosphotransferase [Mucilaginibacter phyllosphaerae]TEW64540.1 polyphosphate kinase 2 family protein [Mucilaginibacter phyllosphaerae]GGH19329.1 PPK2 family polyphosphate--nucleotide phosphotransferase [Mucilaginibacter phyllosphaerae]